MRETKRERTYRFYQSLERLGIDVETADKLRRIEMTLSRWSELECGDSNDYASWAIERDETIYRDWQCSTTDGCGHKFRHEVTMSEHTQNLSGEARVYCPKCGKRPLIGSPQYQDDKPYMVRHVYPYGDGQTKTIRTPIADRETGALKRLAAIMAAYPDLTYYHQTDPRGCALYIVRKADIPTDWFDVIAVNGHFTIQRRGSDSAYSCTIATEAEAREFAARETLNSFYTRGVAVCID